LLIEVGTGNPIVIRDFHPERVRRALARNKAPSCEEGRLKVVTESSRIEKGDEFLNDIVSSLPYCEATSERRYGYHEILIDDERIVGITVCALPMVGLLLIIVSPDLAWRRRGNDRHPLNDMINGRGRSFSIPNTPYEQSSSQRRDQESVGILVFTYTMQMIWI
jgi:hypothetical protein